jgi:hypothetical protein
MELMKILAETSERLTMARRRGGRGEIAWLEAVKEILKAELLRQAVEQTKLRLNAARLERDRQDNLASAKNAVEGFIGEYDE